MYPNHLSITGTEIEQYRKSEYSSCTFCQMCNLFFIHTVISLQIDWFL